jgi:hypothetical protein
MKLFNEDEFSIFFYSQNKNVIFYNFDLFLLIRNQ